MIARDKDVWKKVGQKMHAPGNKEVPMASLHHVFVQGTISRE